MARHSDSVCGAAGFSGGARVINTPQLSALWPELVGLPSRRAAEPEGFNVGNLADPTFRLTCRPGCDWIDKRSSRRDRLELKTGLVLDKSEKMRRA